MKKGAALNHYSFVSEIRIIDGREFFNYHPIEIWAKSDEDIYWLIDFHGIEPHYIFTDIDSIPTKYRHSSELN